MATSYSIVIKCVNAWIMERVCNYLLGNQERNLQRWQLQYADPELSIECLPQDSESTFIVVRTSNTFAANTIMNDVLYKLYEAIRIMQKRVDNDPMNRVDVVTRMHGTRLEQAFLDGECISSNTVQEIARNRPFDMTSDFPALST